MLDRIQPVGVTTDGYTFNIYGRSGSGKTVLACSFPKPLLIIGTEDGTESVSDLGDEGVDHVCLESSPEMVDLLNHAPSKYKTVVLDTASRFQDLILREVLGIKELPAQLAWGTATQQQWGQVGLQCKEHFRKLLDLRLHGLNIVVIAQDRTFGDERDGTEKLDPTVGNALSPSIAGWLNAACNYVVHTYLREETKETIQEVAGVEVPTLEKTGDVEYCLRVKPHPVYMVKFRLPKGTKYDPVMVDPDYDKLAALIEGARNA